jgi:hypothetical protein
LALALCVFCGTIARAATCLSSAADVRKRQPTAWPKWTYGPQGERCWYAGKKPVFAKAAKEVRRAKAQSQPRAAPTEPTSPAPPSPMPRQSEGGNNNIPQPWHLDYRWPK